MFGWGPGLPPAPPYLVLPPHLARVKPILQLIAPADARQYQAVEDMLTQRGEKRAAQSEAQQDKQS